MNRHDQSTQIFNSTVGNYRADIDGLRAISIIAVLLYHAGISKADGGFIGVDVFFVISGYLITAAIIHRLQAGVRLGPFLVDFYERRARRILPSYLATCLLVLAAGYIFFLPDRLLELSKSLLWASLLSANLFFWWTQDYFGPQSDTQPLLHYWSLGVEEHFYIVMPILLFWAWRAKVRIPLIIAILAVLSFVAAEGLVRLHQSTVFYWFPFRAWELLCGSLLAIAGTAPRSSKTSTGAVLVGIAMIGAAILLYRDQMRFPGATALLPCLGAVLVIWGGQRRNMASSLLTIAPAVYIGKISYSLYLIHWPIIVFSHELFPMRQLAAYEIGLSLLAASALYHFVETPTRNRNGFWSAPTRIFALSGVGVGLTIIASIVLNAASGLPGRLPPEAQRHMAFRYDYKEAYREGVCFMTPEQSFADIDSNVCLPSTQAPTVLLWGDSLAAHYASALSEEAAKRGFQFAQLTASMCAPIIGRDLSLRPHCKEFNELTFDWIKENRPATVILSALWPADAGSIELLSQQVSELHRIGISIVVLGQGPIFHDRVPTILAKRAMAGRDTAATQVDVEPRSFATDNAMRSRLEGASSTYISVLDEICPQRACPLAPSGQVYYWDRLHTTDVGSAAIINRVSDRIFEGADPTASLDLVKARASGSLDR